jgi:hypothetical protein
MNAAHAAYIETQITIVSEFLEEAIKSNDAIKTAQFQELLSKLKQELLSQKIKTQINDFFKIKLFDNGFARITTPFLLSDGTVICVYAKRKKDCIILTDYGDFDAWSFSCGNDDLSPEQQKMVESSLKVMKIAKKQGFLIKYVENDDKIGFSVLMFAQAISDISKALVN